MPLHRINRAVLTIVAAISAAIGMSSPPARATVVVNTFDASGGFSPVSNLVAAVATESSGSISTGRMAVAFVPNTTSTLDSITIPIAQVNSAAGNDLRVRIAADSSDRPGSTIEVLSQNAPTPPMANPFTTTTTYGSAAHPALTAGTKYWIVVELSSLPTFATGSGQSSSFVWFFNTSGVTLEKRQQSAVNALPADPWPGSPVTFPIALRVDGTPAALTRCCNQHNGQCAMTTMAACQDLGLAPDSAPLTCSPNTCPHACAADFNGHGLSVSDIFDFLGAWFAGCP